MGVAHSYKTSEQKHYTTWCRNPEGPTFQYNTVVIFIVWRPL